MSKKVNCVHVGMQGVCYCSDFPQEKFLGIIPQLRNCVVEKHGVLCFFREKYQIIACPPLGKSS